MESINEAPSHKIKIKVTSNGPYIVSGGVPLAEQIICVDDEGESHGWRTGKKYPPLQTYALCRCGQSKNKPFCDGTHAKNKFNGTETATREHYISQAERFMGPVLELTDAEDLCASARFCHRAGGIWKLIQKSGDPDSLRIAVEEAGDCPSGRLVVWDKNGKAIESESELSVMLVQDPQAGVSGPIWLRGGIQIESADGAYFEVRKRVTLCRCGQSGNKPFCEGTHVEINFSDTSEALEHIRSRP